MGFWCRMRLLGTAALLVTILLFPGGAGASAAFHDPLDSAAVKVGNLAERPMLAAAKAGNRLVAVGLRGVVIYSDDQGKSWQQSDVPVQSDLVAVYFPLPADGWAVGHDGVILHSSDGGKSWVKQLDGRMALKVFEHYYENKMASADANGTRANRDGTTDRSTSDGAASATVAGRDYATALKVVRENFGTGPNLPFLAVWFKDASTGYAVGSFGTLVTTTDGGHSWQPAFERVDNPRTLNLNALRGIGGRLFVAGERGGVFRLDNATGSFTSLKTGYDGSFFGVAGSDTVLLAFGLQGTIYRSSDGGTTWQVVESPSRSTISAGVYDAQSNIFVLVTVDGELLVGNGDGTEFTVDKGRRGDRYTGICVVSDGRYLVTGLDGVHLTEPGIAQTASAPNRHSK